MGRLGLLLVAILGAFFAFQTMDAAFSYDEEDAQAQTSYLVRAGQKLSRQSGFKSSMGVSIVTVKALTSARMVEITIRKPDNFRLDGAARSAEFLRKCGIYNKSSLLRNSIEVRIRYENAATRGLGRITLSQSACRRYRDDQQIAHR